MAKYYQDPQPHDCVHGVGTFWTEDDCCFDGSFFLGKFTEGTVYYPENYCPDLELVDKAKKKGISDISIEHDPFIGIKGSDIIYTDVWASMGQKEEAELRKKIFEPYQVNKKLFNANE